jgi:TPR repeat protein
MRMCRRLAAAFLTLLIAGVGQPQSVAWSEAAGHASPTEAYQAGLAALARGQAEQAVQALDYAAGKGLLDAQLKLAELYAAGEGVPKSDARSFRYYQRIATQFADAGPHHPVAAKVAEALVALAGYYRAGLTELNIKPDPARAAGLYRHAASYFGSVTAQYNLARMYLAGEGVNKNVRIAVNWLANASRKQHIPSQALLGDLLWRGVSDSYHQPLKGLALLLVARERAVGTADEAWVEELYARAVAEAQPDQREKAGLLASRWNGGRRAADGKSTTTALSTPAQAGTTGTPAGAPQPHSGR